MRNNEEIELIDRGQQIANTLTSLLWDMQPLSINREWEMSFGKLKVYLDGYFDTITSNHHLIKLAKDWDNGLPKDIELALKKRVEDLQKKINETVRVANDVTRFKIEILNREE